MLEINSINKTYANGVKVLNDISLNLPKGMYGLLGPNGAGKSSLMRTIATIQAPDSGSIHFGDIDVLASPQTLRSQLGYLPQDFGVYPGIAATPLLNHFAVMKGLTDKKIREAAVYQLLEMTNLLEHADKPVSSYSGGMQRRFGIAIALLGNPKLIIVDEPTAGLDLAERYTFNSVLAEVSQNAVVLLSTHLVEDIADLCQNFAVIAKGKVLLEGSPQKLTQTLNGKLWQRHGNNNPCSSTLNSPRIISTRLMAGKKLEQAVADECPGNGFITVEPSLQALYFHTLSIHGLHSSQSQI